MRIVTLIAAGLLASSTALAAPSALAGDSAPPKVDDQAVKLSPVGLPIVVEGHVVNYVFVTVVVDLTPSADVIAIREKEPAFRDALVRDAHRTPFVIPGDYNHLDKDKLKAAMFRDAQAIAGARAIKGIEVTNETAQHFIRAAKPAPPVSP
jgi:hypothetical protein